MYSVSLEDVQDKKKEFKLTEKQTTRLEREIRAIENKYHTGDAKDYEKVNKAEPAYDTIQNVEGKTVKIYSEALYQAVKGNQTLADLARMIIGFTAPIDNGMLPPIWDCYESDRQIMMKSFGIRDDHTWDHLVLKLCQADVLTPCGDPIDRAFYVNPFIVSVNEYWHQVQLNERYELKRGDLSRNDDGEINPWWNEDVVMWQYVPREKDEVEL